MLFLQEFFAFLNLMPDLLLISLVLHDQFQLLIQHHHFVQCAVRAEPVWLVSSLFIIN